MPFANSLKRTLRHDFVWLALVSIVLGLWVGQRVTSTPSSAWRITHTLDSVEPLRDPALLAGSHAQAVVTRLRTADTPLVYQPLDESASLSGLLPYGDLEPQRWQAVPADPGTYHIVWQEQDQRLRSALVTTTGETVRGPIELDLDTEQFTALALPDGRAVVVWIGAQSQLHLQVIDQAGRPGPLRSPLPARITHLAAAIDQAGAVHLVWLTSSALRHWTVQHQIVDNSDPVLDAPHELAELTLDAGQTLGSVVLGLDETHGYLFWSAIDTAQPDIEAVHSLIFSLAQPEISTASLLQLPRDYQPTAVSLADTDFTLDLDPRLAADHPAALRWPRVASGQHAFLPLALALSTDHGWRPVVAYFQAGTLLGVQRVADQPADGGPPTVALLPDGSASLVWTGLDGAVLRQYVALSAFTDPVPVRTTATSAADLLAGLLVALPFGLAWLIAPAALMLLTPRNAWTLRLAYVLFGAGQLLWPAPLFAHPPLIGPATATAGALAVMAIGLLAAALVTVGARFGHTGPCWWLIGGLVDTLLTCAVFGANLLA